MTIKNNKDTLFGVYYSKHDYAGFIRRVGAWVIDTTVLASAYYLLYQIIIFFEFQEPFTTIYLIITFIITYLYLAILKRSNFSTLGFKILGIKIVNLFGSKPSLFCMTLRFFLLAIGPFELIIDLLWMTGEGTKQTLRDKYVGTYVVKRNAIPIGKARIISARLNALGYNLLYSEVDIPEYK